MSNESIRKPNSKRDSPPDVKAIRRKISDFLNQKVNGKKIGNCKFGVYIFYDFDGEPIYVGQTRESLRSRIGRHLTNQRTDAVAMNVLDPFEVAEIEVWPLWDVKQKDARVTLNAAEYAVFRKAIARSRFKAVLNEKDVPKAGATTLPPSVRGKIIPDELYEGRKHPDTRIARRASTIAALARVISEREVHPGLRRTLVTQAKRLEKLANDRFGDFKDSVPEEDLGEEV